MKAKQYKLYYPSLIHHFLADMEIPTLPSDRFSTPISIIGMTKFDNKDSTQSLVPKVFKNTHSHDNLERLEELGNQLDIGKN